MPGGCVAVVKEWFGEIGRIALQRKMKIIAMICIHISPVHPETYFLMAEGSAHAPPIRGLFAPGVISLCAVGAGALACAMASVPLALWGRNLIAWIVGGFVAGLIMRGGMRLLAAPLPLAAILLGSALFGPEQSGVHRWLGLGPLPISAAMLTLPAAVVALAFSGGRSVWTWLLALSCMALLAAQPDRSQASAFGSAIIWVALRTIRGRGLQASVVTATSIVLAVAFVRLDPLSPVAEVEGILQLAYQLSPALAAAGLISLLAFCLSPVMIMRDALPEGRVTGEALSVYFLIVTFMPFVGAYPVPLVGMGVSPVFGSWLAIGVLLLSRSAVATADPRVGCTQ